MNHNRGFIETQHVEKVTFRHISKYYCWNAKPFPEFEEAMENMRGCTFATTAISSQQQESLLGGKIPVGVKFYVFNSSDIIKSMRTQNKNCDLSFWEKSIGSTNEKVFLLADCFDTNTVPN